MAHHAVKLPACANCHFAFAEGQPDEFCPRCGQSNRAPNLPLSHLLAEALEGLFHFDSNVWRTLRLLLFRPGELTRRFLVGNRVGYVPPVRLYLLISFVFFLMQSLTLGGHESPSRQPHPAPAARAASPPPASGQAAAPLPASVRDTLPALGQPREQPDMLSWGGVSFSKAELAHLAREPDAAQLDSVLRSKHEPLTFWNRFAVRRLARWYGVSKEEITHQALRGGSILLFLLMPLAALLLKLAYWRRGRFYLNHLIFTVHVHCFFFLLLLLVQLLLWLRPDWDGIGWLLLVLYGYFVLALRRVYGQGWLKTLVKSLLMGFNYSFLFGFAIVAVLALGAAVF